MSTFSYPAKIRRAIYTTNNIESLNAALRKVSKNQALFPNDETVFKLMYLALRNISRRWAMPTENWSGAMNRFVFLFDGLKSSDGESFVCSRRTAQEMEKRSRSTVGSPPSSSSSTILCVAPGGRSPSGVGLAASPRMRRSRTNLWAAGSSSSFFFFPGAALLFLVTSGIRADLFFAPRAFLGFADFLVGTI